MARKSAASKNKQAALITALYAIQVQVTGAKEAMEAMEAMEDMEEMVAPKIAIQAHKTTSDQVLAILPMEAAQEDIIKK